MRTKQLFGVDSDLAQEITNRNYELVKSGTLRVRIESKPEFKSRFGRSPDLADAAFLALDCARQRLGLVAIDPPKDEKQAGFRRQPVTIKELGGALMNSMTCLME
jgi:hypothetical protein